jgi:hypothetical protein
MDPSSGDPKGVVPRRITRTGLLADLYRHLCTALECLPYEYESPRMFFGLPLLSINLGYDNPQGKMRHARGILEIGNQATGILALGIFLARGVFSMAIAAVGFVSVSMASVAFVSVSVFGLGLVSVSVFAVGYLAVGILAVGWNCVGIVAIGKTAVGILGIGQIIHAVFSF